MSVVGGGLLYRGLTGQCQRYELLGVNTARRRNAATGVPGDRGVRRCIHPHPLPAGKSVRVLAQARKCPRLIEHLETVTQLSDKKWTGWPWITSVKRSNGTRKSSTSGRANSYHGARCRINSILPARCGWKRKATIPIVRLSLSATHPAARRSATSPNSSASACNRDSATHGTDASAFGDRHQGVTAIESPEQDLEVTNPQIAKRTTGIAAKSSPDPF